MSISIANASVPTSRGIASRAGLSRRGRHTNATRGAASRVFRVFRAESTSENLRDAAHLSRRAALGVSLSALSALASPSLPLALADASATATFMFRQVFLTIPDEMLESARIDGAGPMRFFWDILIPLSRTNIAALFVILFIYGWNQYLWPLLITTDTEMMTIVVSIKQMLEAAEQSPQWNIIMMTALLAMLPPILVVIGMQKLFVKGLTETDK